MKFLKLILLLNIFLLASFTASAQIYHVKKIEIRNINPAPIADKNYLAIGKVVGWLNGTGGLKAFTSAESSHAAMSGYEAGHVIDNDLDTFYHDRTNGHQQTGANKTFLTLHFSGETAMNRLIVWYAKERQSKANYEFRFFNAAGERLLTQTLDMTTIKNGSRKQVLNLAVPVPAAFFLFAPALLGVIGLRRSARKAKLA